MKKWARTPFGAHAGKYVDELHPKYINWLVNNIKNGRGKWWKHILARHQGATEPPDDEDDTLLPT